MRNIIHARNLVPFVIAAALAAGCSGSNGAPGKAGANGSSCSVV